MSNRTIFMHRVYADESSDEKKEEVFAVAGLVGTEREWNVFEDEWSARMGGIVFHAADLECGHGDFSNYGERERHRWYADMVGILSRSPLLGLGSAVGLQDFWSVFPGVHRDSPYFLCFQHAVLDFAALGSLYLPPDDVEFCFDRNQDYEYNATVLLETLSKNTHWCDRSRLATISFACREKKIGLQAADLLARETFKHRYNQLTSSRFTRSSINRLAETRKYEFRFFVKNDLEILRKLARGDRFAKTVAEYAADVWIYNANKRLGNIPKNVS